MNIKFCGEKTETSAKTVYEFLDNIDVDGFFLESRYEKDILKIRNNNGLIIQDLNILVNGFSISEDRTLEEDDEIILIHLNQSLEKEDYEEIMISRIGYENFLKLKNASVMIFGLGGLGSNIAIVLARTYLGKMILIDFDRVDLSNLNRQHYFRKHLGSFKTESLKSQIEEINPYIDIEIINEKISSKNVDRYLDRARNEGILVIEAFDKVDMKSLLFDKIGLEYPTLKYICGSGMAGFGSSNKIKTRKMFGNIYVCGDEESDFIKERGLFAPRVQICAAHQANMAVRVILGIERA